MTDANDPIALLESLVAFDTQNPPARELSAARHVARVLEAIGLSVEVDTWGEERANVVGRLANGPGPTFAFNTHLDVVPAGEGWSTDPLRLTERDGRLYGRGACDAKGPLAAMIAACADLAADRGAWSGTLVAAFTADEEVASEGARRFAASGEPVDFAVVGEPTNNAIVSAHKGSLRPLVRVAGRTAHSGTPHLGVNAVLAAGRLMSRIETLAARVAERDHPLCGNASLTVTRISGGHADNVVPDACRMLLDRRMVPGEDEADARAEIEALLAAAAREDGIAASVETWRPTTGAASETAADHPLVAAALAASARHGGDGARTFGFMGGCDLVHVRGMGAAGVVAGPGSLEVAHKPDEFVPVAELRAAVGLYADIARAMLRA